MASRRNEMQQAHDKSTKPSTELKKKTKNTHYFSDPPPSSRWKDTPASGQKCSCCLSLLPGPPCSPEPGAATFVWSPPKGFPGLSILREEGAALRFQEHSPEMTLGEASHCQLQNRKITAQNKAFPNPLRRAWRSLSFGSSVPAPAASTYCWFWGGVLTGEGRPLHTLAKPPAPFPHPRYPPAPPDLWGHAHPHPSLSRPGVTRAAGSRGPADRVGGAAAAEGPPPRPVPSKAPGPPRPRPGRPPPPLCLAGQSAAFLTK